jgi:predicted metal-dependent enzyme (double-stranded beta helix superfamily)
MVELADNEREILVIGRDLMTRLVASDDWLPTVFAEPGAAGAAQFQIYSDNLERFSVVSTILSGGATLSIDQPSIWEIMGVLRGEVAVHSGDAGAAHVVKPAAVETRSSRSDNAPQLSNPRDDRLSVSIHVYGGEIGRLSRRSRVPNGQMDGQPLGYANSEAVPPYDIMSIQARIQD